EIESGPDRREGEPWQQRQRPHRLGEGRRVEVRPETTDQAVAVEVRVVDRPVRLRIVEVVAAQQRDPGEQDPRQRHRGQDGPTPAPAGTAHPSFTGRSEIRPTSMKPLW